MNKVINGINQREFIKDCRAGLTLREVAEIMSVHYNTFWAWETERVTLPPERIETLLFLKRVMAQIKKDGGLSK